MRTIKFKLVGTFIAAALGGSLSVLSAPITITSASNVTLHFNGFYDSSQIVIPGLTGAVTLSGFSFTNATVASLPVTIVSMNYTIINDSAFPILTSRISNFAFDTTPTILNTPLNQVSGVFDTVKNNANQPNGSGTVEVCFTVQNCPGGGNGGVTLGNLGSGTASLYFGGNITSFTLDNAYIRYQSVTCTQGSPCNASANGNVTGGGDVPEPSSYALMSLGIAGIAFASRYVRRA